MSSRIDAIGLDFVLYLDRMSQIDCDCAYCKNLTEGEKRSIHVLGFAKIERGLTDSIMEKMAKKLDYIYKDRQGGLFWVLVLGVCFGFITSEGVDVLVDCCSVEDAVLTADQIMAALDSSGIDVSMGVGVDAATTTKVLTKVSTSEGVN